MPKTVPSWSVSTTYPGGVPSLHWTPTVADDFPVSDDEGKYGALNTDEMDGFGYHFVQALGKGGGSTVWYRETRVGLKMYLIVLDLEFAHEYIFCDGLPSLLGVLKQITDVQTVFSVL